MAHEEEVAEVLRRGGKHHLGDLRIEKAKRDKPCESGLRALDLQAHDVDVPPGLARLGHVRVDDVARGGRGPWRVHLLSPIALAERGRREAGVAEPAAAPARDDRDVPVNHAVKEYGIDRMARAGD